MKNKKAKQIEKAMAPLMAPFLPKKKFKNPLLTEKYLEGVNDGFDAGYAEARDNAIAQFSVRLLRLEKVPGLGPKRMDAIDQILREPFTPEEFEQVGIYREQLKAGAGSEQKGN